MATVAEKNQEIPDSVARYVHESRRNPFFNGNPRLFGITKDEMEIKRILTTTEDDLFNEIVQILASNGYDDIIVDQKFFIYAKGDIPIGISVHLDTVFSALPEDIYMIEESGYAFTLSSERKYIGLGADDRAGVYILLKIIEAGYKPGVIITRLEEKGDQGARKAVDTIKDIPDFKYIICLDRKGTNDAVFYRDENKNFHKYMTETFGFKEDHGTVADISVLCPAWKISGVNLSVGYEYAHSPIEMLNIPIVTGMVARVIAMLENPPAEHFTYEEKTYGYATRGTTTNKKKKKAKGIGEEKEKMIERPGFDEEKAIMNARQVIFMIEQLPFVKGVELHESKDGTGYADIEMMNRALIPFDECALDKNFTIPLKKQITGERDVENILAWAKIIGRWFIGIPGFIGKVRTDMIKHQSKKKPYIDEFSRQYTPELQKSHVDITVRFLIDLARLPFIPELVIGEYKSTGIGFASFKFTLEGKTYVSSFSEATKTPEFSELFKSKNYLDDEINGIISFMGDIHNLAKMPGFVDKVISEYNYRGRKLEKVDDNEALIWYIKRAEIAKPRAEPAEKNVKKTICKFDEEKALLKADGLIRQLNLYPFIESVKMYRQMQFKGNSAIMIFLNNDTKCNLYDCSTNRYFMTQLRKITTGNKKINNLLVMTRNVETWVEDMPGFAEKLRDKLKGSKKVRE